jgi:hypothetical protein
MAERLNLNIKTTGDPDHDKELILEGLAKRKRGEKHGRIIDRDGKQVGRFWTEEKEGASRRDMYICAVAQGVLATGSDIERKSFGHVVKWIVDFADALLAEADKEQIRP